MAKKLFTQNSYGFPGPVEALFPKPVIAQRAPTALDTGHSPGQEWVNEATDTIYALSRNVGGVAVWVTTGGGGADVATLSDDAGTIVNPVLGNIQLVGGTNIATLSGAGMVTMNLDGQIELSSVECGTNAARIATFATNFSNIQAYGTDTIATGSARTAIEGNLSVTVGDGTGLPIGVKGVLLQTTGSSMQVSGVTGYTRQLNGSVIVSTATGVEGWLDLLETGAADLPGYAAFAVKGYLDSIDTAGIPGGMVAGVGSIVEYNTPFNAKAYGFLASRLNSGAGAGTAGQAAYGVLQGTVAIPDWLYGLDLYNGAGGSAYTTADIRFQNQSKIAVATEGVTFSGNVAARSLNATNTNITSFDVNPILQSKATTGAAPSGATGDYNIMYCQDGVTMEQFILGAGQTIIAPRLENDGLLISLDLANAEGAEYYFGHTTRSKHAFTIGTSPAFFVEARFKVTDCGSSDPLWLGFRKLGAPNAAYTTYTDAGVIGLRHTTADDVVVVGSNLNNGGWAYVNTTNAFTDGQTHTLRVNVSAAGVVTYLIDGVAPIATQALTFDAADVVIPFIHHLFIAAGGAPGAIDIVSLKCGYQSWT